MIIDIEDYFCDNCHTEFIFDVNLHEDLSTEDVKYCPFCGSAYDNELNLDKPKFSDEFNEYDE